VFNQSTYNETLFNAGAGFTPPPLPPAEGESSFNRALAFFLYPNTLERERLTLYGGDAYAELIAVSPAGEEVLYALTNGPWVARRIPTIESGGDETWRLEIAGELTDWNVLKNVTKVRLRGATDEEQMYEVLGAYNAMKPGKVYHIRMQAICNIDPS
jgi:hypothetical protein